MSKDFLEKSTQSSTKLLLFFTITFIFVYSTNILSEKHLEIRAVNYEGDFINSIKA